jgi:hypothetical protein
MAEPLNIGDRVHVEFDGKVTNVYQADDHRQIRVNPDNNGSEYWLIEKHATLIQPSPREVFNSLPIGQWFRVGNLWVEYIKTSPDDFMVVTARNPTSIGRRYKPIALTDNEPIHTFDPNDPKE